MLLTISCEKVVSKGGAAFRANGVELTGFGMDEQSALRNTKAGIIAWSQALARQGILEEAIERAGLRIDDDGDSSIHVSLQVQEDTEDSK